MTDDMPGTFRRPVPEVSDGGKEQARLQAAQFWAEVPGPRLDVPSLCKHKLADCLACGVTERRDVRHSTVGGRGAVARLSRR